MHNGIDFGGVPRGHVWTSPYAGIVTHLGTHGTRGKVAVIRIAGTNILQIMQHLDEYRCKPGDQIEKGFPVGTNGITGNVTGPHLHYELRIDNGSALGSTVWGDPALFTGGEVIGMKTYTVVRGDTLAGIAARFGVTVADLRKWNNRTPEQDRSLAIGTVLFVSTPEAGPVPPVGGVSQEDFAALAARVIALEDKLLAAKQVL